MVQALTLHTLPWLSHVTDSSADAWLQAAVPRWHGSTPHSSRHCASKGRKARFSLPVAMAQGAAGIPAPREHLAIGVNGQGTPAASNLQGHRAGLGHGPRMVWVSAGRHISNSGTGSWGSISTPTASSPEGPCQTPVP